MIFQRGLLLFWLALLCSTLPAQQPLRVGVVLSGGGAKGVAHVGALRVLEEAGIRIDYIGGTSMGGIVGGLYAAGWSVAQIDSILHVNNLETVLQDKVERDYQTFFTKQYGERYALRLSFQDFKLALPKALSDGQQAFDFLSELTDHVAAITDFSALPVPFLCIGTDLSTGEQVVMEQGCLARAIRAGGSFPGLLAPVEIDGRLISDGAIVNNFPAREVREKGMDIVIGVNVEAALYRKEELGSIEKIIEQIGSYRMTAHTREQVEFCDLIIRPSLDGYSVTSFDAIDTILLRGERAARLVWDSLLAIAQRQQAAPQPAPRARPVLPAAVKPMVIRDIQLTRNPAISERALTRKFPVPLPGEISFEKFRKGIAALYATDNFQYIDYHFAFDSSGARDLLMRLQVKPGYESSLRMGLHFDNVYKSGLLLNGTFRNLLLPNSIASFDLILGDKFRYNAHYYVGEGRGSGLGFNSRLNLVNFDGALPAQVDTGGALKVQNLLFDLTDLSNEAYFNLAANNQFATGMAAEIKFFKTSTGQLLDSLSGKNYVDEQGWYFTGKAFFRFDSRDRAAFTRHGVLTNLELRTIHPISSLKYENESQKLGWNIDLQLELTRPLSERLSWTASTNIGFLFGAPAPPWRYYLGSNNRNLINNFRAFPGLSFAEATGDNLVQAGLQLQYRLFQEHYLSCSGHLASLNDKPEPFTDGQGVYRSVALTYGINTFLGPVELTYAASNQGGHVYFNLGYWF